MLQRKVFSFLVVLSAALTSPGYARRSQIANPATTDLAARTAAAHGLLSQAKAAALRITDNFQRGLVLDEIGAAQAISGDIDGAVDTASQAYPHTMVTLRAVGEQLGNSNDLLKGQSIEPKLQGGGSSTLFAFMSRRQAENGKLDDAFRTIEKIQAPEVRSDALQWIAEKQTEKGDDSGAQKTMVLARAADPNRHFDPDDMEIRTVESQLVRGDMQGARATIASITSPEARSFAMIGYAVTLWQKGDKSGAAAWLRDALTQLPPGPSSEFSRYTMIPTQVKLGQKQSAMQAAGSLSRGLRVKGYSAIAVTCAEIKDLACVDITVKKMRSVARSQGDQAAVSRFGLKLMLLNITAALIDNSQPEAARRILATIELRAKDRFVEPSVQLQRVFMLAQQGRFREARSLALKMRPDSVADVQRGTAWRITGLLQTKKSGAASTQLWASALTDPDDRAYAFLGIAQALLGIGEVKLGYSAIQIH